MYVLFCTFLFMDIQYCPKVWGQKLLFFFLKKLILQFSKDALN